VNLMSLACRFLGTLTDILFSSLVASGLPGHSPEAEGDSMNEIKALIDDIRQRYLGSLGTEACNRAEAELKQLQDDLATANAKAVCGCGIPLGYHEEEQEMEWCRQEPITGICKKHWDKFMDFEKQLAAANATIQRASQLLARAQEINRDADGNGMGAWTMYCPLENEITDFVAANPAPAESEPR
jgi:hypothetical protein